MLLSTEKNTNFFQELKNEEKFVNWKSERDGGEYYREIIVIGISH